MGNTRSSNIHSDRDRATTSDNSSLTGGVMKNDEVVQDMSTDNVNAASEVAIDTNGTEITDKLHRHSWGRKSSGGEERKDNRGRLHSIDPVPIRQTSLPTSSASESSSSLAPTAQATPLHHFPWLQIRGNGRQRQDTRNVVAGHGGNAVPTVGDASPNNAPANHGWYNLTRRERPQSISPEVASSQLPIKPKENDAQLEVASQNEANVESSDMGKISKYPPLTSNTYGDKLDNSVKDPVNEAGEKNSKPAVTAQPTSSSIMFTGTSNAIMSPTSFEFSPPSSQGSNSCTSPLHLSFVSCPQHIHSLSSCSKTIPLPPNPLSHCAGYSNLNASSPKNTQKIAAGVAGDSCRVPVPVAEKTPAHSAQSLAFERRLYVLPIEPLLQQLNETDETHHGSNNDIMALQDTSSNNPYLERRYLASELAVPLIHQIEDTEAIVEGTSKNDLTHLNSQHPSPFHPPLKSPPVQMESEATLSLQERLRRERQRFVWNEDGESCGITQFIWSRMNKRDKTMGTQIESVCDTNDTTEKTSCEKSERCPSDEVRSPPKQQKSDYHELRSDNNHLRILVPLNGNIYVQDGIGADSPNQNSCSRPLMPIYDKRKMAWDLYYTKWWDELCKNNNHCGTREKRQKRCCGADEDSVEDICSWVESREESKTDDGNCQSAVPTSVDAEKLFSAIESANLSGCDLSAIDPQMSPDGTMVAFVLEGEIYVVACDGVKKKPGANSSQSNNSAKSHTGSSNESDFHGHNPQDETQQTLRNCHFPMELQQLMPTRITYGSVIDGSAHLDGFFRELMSKGSRRNNNHNTHGPSLQRNQSGNSQHISHGLADFVSQEEMDRYSGFWWSPDSTGILFAKVDETIVPPYRIMHDGQKSASRGLPACSTGSGVSLGAGTDAYLNGSREKTDGIAYEDHRYPFAGNANPFVKLGYVKIDRNTILGNADPCFDCIGNECTPLTCGGYLARARKSAISQWSSVVWFESPPLASEYLARVNWLPDGSACAQWQNRKQSILQLLRIDVSTGEQTVMLTERSEYWINLHNMFWTLERPIHPDKYASEARAGADALSPLPEGSFSFIFASERTSYSHLYLYTFVAGSCEEATLIRAISGGEWVVESIVGVDILNDCVFVTGTFDSPLERHLYALPLSNWKNAVPPLPVKLSRERGMHNIVMDDDCRVVVDTSSDLDRPPTTKLYAVDAVGLFARRDRENEVSSTLRLLFVLHDSEAEDSSADAESGAGLTRTKVRSKQHHVISKLHPPRLLTFQAHNSTDTLFGALYLPKKEIHGPGPYPLICSVYGGPHVQRVTRCWSSITSDMRAQRLAALGFAVLKCDNRGSSRRGLKFEGEIKGSLGKLEVRDQVAAVKQLVEMGIVDKTRVGIYGWSYGGYLALMCLCRAPDVFHCAIAGAPVTSWDGYDTHYTERYMGLPSENAEGYCESSVFGHVSNLSPRQRVLLIHGLLDENVHFRHTARLINRMVASGKDYDLMVFPDERHSPRRLSDRLYMEKKICEYFMRNMMDQRQT